MKPITKPISKPKIRPITLPMLDETLRSLRRVLPQVRDPLPPLSALQLPVNELPHRPCQLITPRPGALNNLARDLRGYVA
jgi:hypothetical protein